MRVASIAVMAAVDERGKSMIVPTARPAAANKP
jgi:hypothetical protein